MFKNYHDAYSAAVRKARELVAQGLAPEQAEQGLEFNALCKSCSFMTLPLRKNCYGFELRCEVVRPTDPEVL